MNKVTHFICFIAMFQVLFLSGCSKNTISQFALLANFGAQKINNLTDLDNDKKSDLIFWNTSSMSNPTKFLEPCFFESISLKGKSLSILKLGEAGDIPFIGYFDDDSVIDYGVYRGYNSGDSEWFIKKSRNANVDSSKFGNCNDLPVSSDYDGDEKSDLAIYRSKDSTFLVILSKNQQHDEVKLGNPGDIPVPKDYDGDGKCDFATYRQENGTWVIKTSKNSTIVEKVLGGPYYFPFPSDYDGDGKADLLVYNFLSKSVKIHLSKLSEMVATEIALKIKNQLKQGDFFPVPSDYDGDGLSEIAFWSDSLKILLYFKLDKDYKKFVYHYPNISNSIPVNSFILRKLFQRMFNKTKNVYDFETPGFFAYDNNTISKFIFNGGKGNDLGLLTLSKTKKGNSNIFISDFDSDYINDICLWSKEIGTFLCDSSRVGLKYALDLGESSDVPIIGNFNGDGFIDLGIYRTGSMTFYYRLLGKYAPNKIQFVRIKNKEVGISAIPHISDYDGDKKDDFALYIPNKNIFIVKRTTDFVEYIQRFKTTFNTQKTTPVKYFSISADFDGDSKSDLGIIDPTSGHFTYLSSLYNLEVTSNINIKSVSGYLATDFDGDMKADLFFIQPDGINIFLSSKNFTNPKTIISSEKAKKIKLANCTWLL